MAFSKRTINKQAVINFDDEGAFVSGFRLPLVQMLEDGAVIAERPMPPVSLTLAQIKTYVAGL